jgi:hypothetical protein
MNTVTKIAFLLKAYCATLIFIHAAHAMEDVPGEKPNREQEELLKAIFDRLMPDSDRLNIPSNPPVFHKKGSPKSPNSPQSTPSSPQTPRKPWNPGEEPPVFEESGSPQTSRSKMRIVVVSKPKSPKND